ncbi:PPC domain-containing DNA-binding protein [Clostridium ganghwense]|uniref:DNA-binding protein n=1 Tax=Clostridium ganghwense TaxID=312089 RepID=A0ABT4CP20_9CLOT|nr:DNA-binding protein [Clostridium ganghwense]
MKTYSIRLIRGQDLKEELINFTRENNIKAGCILTCVGCVTRATLRMANASLIKDFENNYEIVSLVGTLCKDGVHLHISLSDKDGKVIGGHMKENCLVGTTAEIIIGELENVNFTREFDEQTGYDELNISKQ